ncbi:hypothetical protein J2Z83_003216 [Virgibacillus natechei]|uniref:Uncharacterized protein n=1 Tax=Virgibacillus natechei TaxID=1216297 RepID=A0ABS4IM63_9BACI|nr:hypothetical protein [Virgibacillus natechei]
MGERVVFQGVHMLFSGTNDRVWKPGEPNAVNWFSSEII